MNILGSKTKLFRWNPNIDLLAVGISWLLVVGAISAATFIATAQQGVLYFLLYGIVGATLFGIGIPVLWMVFFRRKHISSLGITKKYLRISLLVQLVLAALLYWSAFSKTTIPNLESLIPLVALTLSIGFFEAVFWRGWVLLRIEEAFGLLPAILLGSFLYDAYHIGYGMPISEMVFLFFIGIMFAVIFRFTNSIFILWPLFQPIGQLLTLFKDQLSLPTIAALGFIEALILMITLCWFIPWLARKRKIYLV